MPSDLPQILCSFATSDYGADHNTVSALKLAAEAASSLDLDQAKEILLPFAKDKDNPAAALALAEILLHSGTAEQALPLLEPWTIKLPDHPEVWIDFGIAALNARRFDKAIKAFEKVIALSAENIEAQKFLARAHYELGRPKKAKSLLEKVIERSPNDTVALQQQIFIYAALGERSPAIKIAKRLLEFEPLSAFAFSYLVDEAFNDSAPFIEHAISNFDTLDENESATLAYALGRFYEKQQDFDQAFVWFKKQTKDKKAPVLEARPTKRKDRGAAWLKRFVEIFPQNS